MSYIATIKEPRRVGLAYEVRLRRNHDRGRIVWVRGAFTSSDAQDLARRMEAAARQHGDAFEADLVAGKVALA